MPTRIQTLECAFQTYERTYQTLGRVFITLEKFMQISDAIAFHTTAAVVQQNYKAKVLQLILEIVQGLITKIQFGGIMVRTKSSLAYQFLIYFINLLSECLLCLFTTNGNEFLRLVVVEASVACHLNINKHIGLH